MDWELGKGLLGGVVDLGFVQTVSLRHRSLVSESQGLVLGLFVAYDDLVLLFDSLCELELVELGVAVQVHPPDNRYDQVVVREVGAVD